MSHVLDAIEHVPDIMAKITVASQDLGSGIEQADQAIMLREA